MEEKNFFVANKNYHDINPRDCGYQACAPSHAYGPAVRDYYLLHFVLSGTGKLIKGETEYIINENQCFLIRPGETTYYQADEKHPWKYIWIGFNAEVDLPKVLNENDVFDALMCKHVFLSLLQIGNDFTQLEPILCSRIWELFTLFLTIESSRIDNENAIVEKAKNYIENEYMNDISIEKIANMLYVDRTYFSKSFKLRFGISPKDYLSAFRLEKAATLLTEQKYNSYQISQMTGYNDYCNFSKMFKRMYGVSPSKYTSKK
ncbi:MAG: AraC family transcriptional regulator [Oscillospiraceae bacterium]|nr:AraC family transcriptional regulator [Oscillospiraceae bacterium]